MNELWERLLLGWGELLDVLPGLLAAAVIMLAGYFVARQLQRWTARTLQRLHFKRLADAGGLTEAVGRMRLDPVRATAKLVFWMTMLVVVLLASSALGLENVREMFGRMVGFIPTLISGVVIVILGLIIGEFVRALIVASAGAVEGVVTVAKLVKGVMVMIAVFMALQQVGVDIAGQQRGLEEGQAGIPDGRRAAQQGQNQLGHHGLDHEHQGGAGEDRDHEQRGNQAGSARAGRGNCGHAGGRPSFCAVGAGR